VGFGAQLLKMSSSLLSVKDYVIPFQTFIPPKSSTFEVLIPWQYLEGRKFQFEHLTMEWKPKKKD